MPIREKKHRLSPPLYHGPIAAAFTLCLKNREPFFITRERFKTMQEILFQSLRRFTCDAYIYLFMPDHLHLLLKGKSDNSDLYACVKHFKQYSGYWFYKSKAGVEWQKSFYDHILRQDEEIEKQVRYILGNPLRRGLTQNWKTYSYKGSTMYNFEDWDVL